MVLLLPYYEIKFQFYLKSDNHITGDKGKRCLSDSLHAQMCQIYNGSQRKFAGCFIIGYLNVDLNSTEIFYIILLTTATFLKIELEI